MAAGPSAGQQAPLAVCLRYILALGVMGLVSSVICQLYTRKTLFSEQEATEQEGRNLCFKGWESRTCQCVLCQPRLLSAEVSKHFVQRAGAAPSMVRPGWAGCWGILAA